MKVEFKIPQIWVLLILLLLSLNLTASDSEIFEQAVQYYEQRDYESALANFISIEENGIINADLFYNIGNCYYRLNKIGLAILYYKKGLRVNPNHPQLQFNLKYALSRTIDRQEPVDDNPLLSLLKKSVNYLSVNTHFLLLFIIFVLIVITINVTIIYYKRRDKTLIYSILGLLIVLFVISAIIGHYRWTQFYNESEAVLIYSDVTGYSGPNEDFSSLFKINEGVILNVLKTEGDWSQIRLANGVSGWIKTAYYRKVSFTPILSI